MGWTHRASLTLALALATLGAAGPAWAADALTILELVVERPTPRTAGVQLLIADDDDRDATVAVRVRLKGAGAWREQPPLVRVWPEVVAVPVPEQLAGSVFDLEPGQLYEIELHVVDPDGPLDALMTVEASTRPLPPAGPRSPVIVAVSDPGELAAALQAAAPGHVITLAPGTYPAQFLSLQASGTAQDPIVLRGEDPAAVILDGGGCPGCNALEVYGSHVIVEGLTIRGAQRALRFQGQGATANVARRLIIRDVVHGVGSKPDQSDFYVCDNDIEGRLVWPWPFSPDAQSHWDDRGVDLSGDGHVVCHNRIVGFGDPVVNKAVGFRAFDVYGNDIAAAQDGVELDEGAGSLRLFHNRFTDVMAPISIQPAHGGPAHVLRNVAFNAADEPIKLKSLGGVQEPSGVRIHHNTFVSPALALNLQTPITQHNLAVTNNLFVGPEQLEGPRTVDWTAKIAGGRFDVNGYYPDGGFWLGVVEGVNVLADDFAGLVALGVFEQSGVLLSPPVFAAGFVGPPEAMAAHAPVDVSLDPDSEAVDAGEPLPGINDRHAGAGPDLGARERGCPPPRYGPRPRGEEGIVAAIDCAGEDEPPTTGTDSDTGTTGDPTTGGDPTSSTDAPTSTTGDPTSSTGAPSTTAGATDEGSSGDGSGDAGQGGEGCGCRRDGSRSAGLWLLILVGSRGSRRRPPAPGARWGLGERPR